MSKSKKDVSTAIVSPSIATQTPLIYADSVGNFLMSPINSRLTFVLNVGPAKDGVQPTVPTIELVIPTHALLAFAKKVYELVRDREPEFAKAYESTAKQVADLAGELRSGKG